MWSERSCRTLSAAALGAGLLAGLLVVGQTATDGSIVSMLGGITEVHVVTEHIVIRSPEQPASAWPEDTYLAPRVPEDAAEYIVPGLQCESGAPRAAWHEVTASHPGYDLFYSVAATLTAAEEVQIAVRTREHLDGSGAAYIYADIHLLCVR